MTTISPFSLSLPYRTENRRFSTLSCTKTGSTQPKLSAACFVVQSCLADADFVVFSNYCLIGTRPTFSISSFLLWEGRSYGICQRRNNHAGLPFPGSPAFFYSRYFFSFFMRSMASCREAAYAGSGSVQTAADMLY